MRSYQGSGYRLLYDIVRESAPVGPMLTGADSTVRYFLGLQRLGHVPVGREAFCALLLNARHRVLGFHLISIGTLDSSAVHPREVMRMAVTIGAAAIVIAHNHPSGDSTPSENDRLVTERLQKVGKLLGIDVLDHVVIGTDKHYSFADGRTHPNAR